MKQIKAEMKTKIAAETHYDTYIHHKHFTNAKVNQCKYIHRKIIVVGEKIIKKMYIKFNKNLK